MATERAMRIVDTSTTGKWGSVKDPASFGSHNLVVDELGLLLKGHKTHEDQTRMVPNRSGSAPPSMEGSYASFGNLLYSQKSSWDSALASSGSGFQYYQPEDRLRSNPSNDVMTTSDINPTAKFPQPFMSREGKKQTQYMGAMGSNWKLKSSGGGSSDGSLLLTRSSLSTHHEEPEDDISSQKTSEDLVDNSPSSQRKNLVDLKQAPAYNETHSSHVATNEAIVSEIETPELNNLSLNVTKSPDPKPSVDSGARVENSYWSKVQDNSSADLVPKNTYLDKSGDMSSTQKNAADSKGKFHGKDGILGSNTQESKMYETNSIQQQLHRSYQHSQVQGYQGQATAQSNNMFGDSRNVLQGPPPNFSLQSSGPTPPLYASAAAYMTSGNQYYSNPHPPLYAPPYSTGGYPFGSTYVPSLVAGYPPHAGLPIAFDPGSTQSLNSQTIVSPGETNTQVGELPLYNKFYGHQGFVVQPPFPDPHQMPYFHYPSENSFSPQYGRIPPANLPGDQFGPFAPQRDPTMPAYVGDNKFPFSPNASLSIMSPRKVGMPSNNFYGTTAGYAPHYPGSLGSPLMPGSPVGAASPSGRRYDPRFPQGFVRNSGVYAGWQGQRGPDSHIDSKKHSFLEELKANNARKFNLSDIAERIVEFSVDQHGSRFIQQKLENCSAEEKASVFKEVLPHASRLMTDVFGNYVIQKFFEYGDSEQRKELANKLSGQMLPLSLQMYGCRVIQKALEVIELDQKTTLAHELDGHVMRCVRDQNGNHVIQKCIECLPTENIGFIISAFRGQVATLSTHPYGCRVIQRVLEHCSDESQTQCIVDEILESSYILAQDQYGNYVTQHVLERGKPHERNKVISKLQGKIIQMSQHKYASNVVEKCLEYGDGVEREIMVNEILAQPEENDNLLVMMKDQYANYVVQKILEISNEYQHDLLLKRIRGHIDALKKYTYGKHIVARFEQLSGEEEEEEEEEEDSGTSEP